MRLTLGQIAAATGGTLAAPAGPSAGAVAGAVADAVADAVVIDSRLAGPGALFVALPGEHADGHDFAAAALAAGAVAVLAQRPVAGPHVLVPDVLAALGALAGAWRDLLPARVTGLTGSVGKTSTKDLLAALLGRLGPTVAPPGSWNNDIGLPLTMLSAGPGAAHLVLEMGARAPGDIARLCRLARPQTALVLNVGSAHLGEFGSRAAIAAAKGELAEAATDLVVLNADDPLVAAMAARATAPVRTFGLAGDVRAEDVAVDAGGHASFRLVAPEGSAPVRLRLVGEHHVANVLAAAAVALAAGLSPAEAGEALSVAEPASRWRMEIRERADGVTVVNDAYNANPESVRAALKALVAMTRPTGRRSWAVLGEMLELGDGSRDAHDALGRLAVRLDVNRLVSVGPGTKVMHLAAAHEGSWGQESIWVPDIEAALAHLRAELRAGDVVLVKASRGVGLERIAMQLLADDAAAAAPVRQSPGAGGRGAGR